MMIPKNMTGADVDRAIRAIEVAAIYLEDGAPITALARLREALPVVEALATAQEKATQ